MSPRQHAHPDIAVAMSRIAVAAVSRAAVRRIVVPRPAAQRGAFFSGMNAGDSQSRADSFVLRPRLTPALMPEQERSADRRGMAATAPRSRIPAAQQSVARDQKRIIYAKAGSHIWRTRRLRPFEQAFRHEHHASRACAMRNNIASYIVFTGHHALLFGHFRLLDIYGASVYRRRDN